MCVRSMLLKSANPESPVYGFIPCGKCEECRDSKRNQWTFRNRCELEYARRIGWHIGFFTLTYDDQHIPTIPEHMFVGNYERLMCFSRRDVRLFIDNIRKRVNEKFGVSGLRYLVASEFGSSTKRSHYHGIIMFPPEVSPEYMFDLIKRSWPNGHIFPRYITGGLDSHGYMHKPFLLTGDIAGAARYAAKYCCKDIGYSDYVKGYTFVEDESTLFCRLRDFAPFHIQSRSFGKCYLANLDPAKLEKVLMNGDSFVGESKTLRLPLYIRNKILYNIKYVFDDNDTFDSDGNRVSKDWWYDFECDKWRFLKGRGTHRRLVRREATAFFEQHYPEIFEQKRQYFDDLFSKMATNDYWRSHGLKESDAAAAAADCSSVTSIPDLAAYYLAYFGVPKSSRFELPYDQQWFSRYWKKRTFVSSNVLCWNYDVEINKMLRWLRYAHTYDDEKRAQIRKIIDYYKSSA